MRAIRSQTPDAEALERSLSATAIRYAALLLEPLRIGRNVGRSGEGGVISDVARRSDAPADLYEGVASPFPEF